MWRLEYRVQSSEFVVQGLRLRVKGLGFRIVGCELWDGFMVYGYGLRI